MSSVSTNAISPTLRESLATIATFTTTTSGNDVQNINRLYRFDGTNYQEWSGVFRTFLMECGKVSHLTDEGPNQTDPEFKAWDMEDSMIMSWLLNSMKPEISRNLMFLTTAKAIWEILQQIYSKKKDAAVFYDLKIRVSFTKQGKMSIIDYYNRIAGLWLEIDHNRDLELKSSHDVDVVQELLQNDRVFEFLAGLNAEYDQIRVQILGKNPVPSLEEILSIVRAEESRRQGDSVMVSRWPARERNMGNAIRQPVVPKKTYSKDELWCTHCHKPRHMIESCYKVHGKAQVLARTGGLEGQAESQANMGNVEATKSSKQEFTKLGEGNTERLRSLLNALEKSSGSFSLAEVMCLNDSFEESNTEQMCQGIVDSVATDRMIHNNTLFDSYNHGSGNPLSHQVWAFNGEVTTPSVVTSPVNKVDMVQFREEHQQAKEETKHGDDDSRLVDKGKIADVCDQVLGKRSLDIDELENGSKRAKSTSFEATSGVQTS